jgi:hypothetical protein
VNQSNSDVLGVRRVSKTTKIDYKLRQVCLFVGQHGTTRLHLDTFSLNLVFEYLSKIYRGNSCFIDI